MYEYVRTDKFIYICVYKHTYVFLLSLLPSLLLFFPLPKEANRRVGPGISEVWPEQSEGH